MVAQMDEKQIAIKLNEYLISSLDALAKAGGMNRNHLMLSFVNTWVNVLDESSMRGLFYISNLLRVREVQSFSSAFEHEFTESRIPEKPLPMKFSDSSITGIDALASVNHISRHQLLKTMIIVGIEELEKITERRPYKFCSIEFKLHNSFSNIMKKGFKAFKAYIK